MPNGNQIKIIIDFKWNSIVEVIDVYFYHLICEIVYSKTALDSTYYVLEIVLLVDN